MDKLPDFVYSLDEEWFEEFEVIQDQVNDDNEPGEKVSGYKGVPIPVSHLDIVKLCRPFVESLQEAAYDEDGDAAEDYLMDFTNDMEEGLQEVIAQYLEDNVRRPTYYRIGDIQPHIFTSESYDE